MINPCLSPATRRCPWPSELIAQVRSAASPCRHRLDSWRRITFFFPARDLVAQLPTRCHPRNKTKELSFQFRFLTVILSCRFFFSSFYDFFSGCLNFPRVSDRSDPHLSILLYSFINVLRNRTPDQVMVNKALSNFRTRIVVETYFSVLMISL